MLLLLFIDNEVNTNSKVFVNNYCDKNSGISQTIKRKKYRGKKK